MNNYYLLFFLPADLVHYIFKIILREKNANIIIKRFHFNKISNLTIKNIINFINNRNGCYMPETLIDNLNYVLHKNMSKKYNKVFWQHLLNLLSNIFGDIHIRMVGKNMNINNNIQYKNLKIIIKLWFKICQKYNIKLKLSEYINIKKKDQINFKIINSKHIIKLLDFNKYFISPRVVINQYDTLTLSENYNFINNFIT